ncbi:hypothetical protein GCM10027589_01370 [Actinocorallia lasiicapitis]
MIRGRGVRVPAGVAVVVAAPVLAVVTGAPAHAASWCNAPVYKNMSDSVSRVEFTYRACSDAISVSGGKVHDINCDGRAAKVDLSTQYAPWQNPTNWMGVQRGGPFTASTGCGYWSSFADFTLKTRATYDHTSNLHRFRVCLWAENTWGSSNATCTTVLSYNI